MDIEDRLKLVREIRSYDLENHLGVETTSIFRVKEGANLEVRVSISGVSNDYNNNKKDMFEQVKRTHVLSTWPVYKLGMGAEIVNALKLELAKRLFNF